jgi:molecular chaperone HtpG
MGDHNAPVTITQSEYMRRMKEMAAIQPGMSFYGEMPDMFNILLNEDNNIVKRIMKEAESACNDKLQPLNDKLAELENRRNELNEASKDKKIEDIPQSEKDALADTEKEIANVKSNREAIMGEYASGSKEIKQLIDLTLLQNNMLTGEALSNFVKRSIEMMK